VKKKYRLVRREDFARVRSEGRSWAHPLLVLYARPNGLPVTRVGVTVSRRLGKAVVRNRVRRCIREAVRLVYPQIPSGWDLLWIARTGSVAATFAEIQTAVRQLLQQAGLLRLPTERLGAAGGPSVAESA